MGPRPLFTAFGIPVSFDPFFLFGAFLVYSWSGGGRYGLYTVVAMVVFVVIHEFGHALTAKAFGSSPAIVVTFLGGYASYAPTKSMTTRHSIAISVAGPLTQLVASLPVLWWAIHRLETATDRASASAAIDVINAVGWAGVLLAFLNLVPLWPLDGGHIAESLAARVFGPRVLKPMLIGSLVGAAFMTLMYLLVRGGVTEPLFSGLGRDPRVDVFSIVVSQALSLPSLLFGETIFIPIFVALGAWSRLSAIRRFESRVRVDNAPTRQEMAHEDAVRATRNAERDSWTNGRLAEYPRGWEPSPWVKAHVELVAGRRNEAIRNLMPLANGHSRKWLLDRPDRPEIEHLLTFVPPEAAASLAVLEARVHHGSAEDLVALATTLFLDERSAEPLYLGAAGLAVRGMDDEAMAWLQRAVNVAPDPHRMSVEPEFRGLHRRSDFQSLLGEAQRAVGNPR